MSYTWTTFQWASVHCIEDPIFTSYIPTKQYFCLYQPLLETFDGSDPDSFIDCFFERSPLNPGLLLFVDDDSRLDFHDMAIEMNLALPMKEVCEGESAKQKQIRKLKEKQKHNQKQKKRKMTMEEKKQIKYKQMLSSMDKIRERLENEESPDIRQRLSEKLERMSVFVERHSV